MHGYIKERAYVKRSRITPRLANRIREQLTYTSYSQDTIRSTSAGVEAFGKTPAKVSVIENFWVRGNYVSLPRAWAIQNIKGDYEDHTDFPKLPQLAKVKKVEARDSKQQQFFDSIFEHAARKGPQHIVANATTGCHAAGTFIQMFDARPKKVEDIRVGDYVLGPDSLPRQVLRLCRGQQDMYKITPKSGGEPFVVNADHVLHLVRTRSFYGDRNLKNRSKQQAGEVTHISVSDYMNRSATFKHLHKLVRVATHYPPHGMSLPLDPYALGLWLGDGTSRSANLTSMDSEIISYYTRYALDVGCKVRVEYGGNTGKAAYIHIGGGHGSSGANPIHAVLQNLDLVKNKHIPERYLKSSENDRLSLLAGIIDTDGHLATGYYEVTQKRKALSDDIRTLARSLGFSVNRTVKYVNDVPYYRQSICGDIDRLPVKVSRKKACKRLQKKNPLVTGFDVEGIGADNFYGFTLDGDHLYLTDDFMVHHNSGKTVCQIQLGLRLRTRTLLLVDSNKIANGYLKNFQKFFGKEWTEANVGRLQQDTIDYNKPFVIGMVQSLSSRHYPPAVYSAFGLVCYDEVQIYGNLSYHRVLGMFTARVLAGFTATNKEGDFGKVITSYLGKPAVISTQKTMTPDIHVVTYQLPYVLNTFSDGALINSLVKVADRNAMLASLIYEKAHKRDRVCLVFSDRVAQLQTIQKALIKLGVPKKRIGLHVGEYEDGTWTVGYRVGSTLRKLNHLACTEKDAKGIATMLNNGSIGGVEIPVALAKRIANGEETCFEPIRNIVKPTEEELDSIANSCYIILATFKIFGKGVDYPRIDMGVEASPIGGVTQPLGRITRLLDGKVTPEWWSVYDRFLFTTTKAERFGTPEADNEAQVDAMNAFFDAKHTMRKKGYAIAQANVTYHKADEFRSKK